MDFDFTDEQYALRDAARDFFAGECPPSRVRARWDGDDHDEQLWRSMAETGFIGLTVPTEHGGLGLGDVDLTLLLHEAGRAVVPAPLLETTAIAAPLLVEAGTDQQRQAWLPRITAGEAVVTVQLDGAPFVVDADVAQLLLLERDGQLHAVPRELFQATRQPSLDGARRVFTVEAETGDDTRMAGGPQAAAKAFDRGAAGTAAILNGLSERLLEMTVAYVLQREQFGRPVGSFQAVKHKLAETMLLTEPSKAATWYAAYAIACDLDDRSEAASVAKSFATQAAAKASAEALQCHGGIGFTWEHDLHLWLKRGKALESSYGTAAAHRARLAEVVFAS
ncbi:MAG: acyl-CoA/acyl-ACP dehydrogenase [Euzebyales bacterium]|jgi:alkylation response protein AidB-like acyl-CoA dehydrogenase|nr:acyl-CoA/acyl-ACP dehydrogenase [Euzebyales bacterium]